jgi:hypothetical protein
MLVIIHKQRGGAIAKFKVTAVYKHFTKTARKVIKSYRKFIRSRQ